MNTFFQVGFTREAWKPLSLGQAAQSPSITDVIAKGLTTGAEAYGSYSEKEQAEAEAEAARAQAEAAKAQAAAAAAAASGRQPAMLLGVPVTYWVVGALGLGAIGVLLAMTGKKK